MYRHCTQMLRMIIPEECQEISSNTCTPSLENLPVEKISPEAEW